MLNAVIRFSLRHRLPVITFAVMLVCAGTWQALRTPIDVFPDLNRPRVVLMTEAPGMAPEEVETLITLPLETAMNGAQGVEAVRSSSGAGISVINVEFAYGTDLYLDRQIVAERLQLVRERLPRDVTPQPAPVSSIMGQILMLGVWSDREDVGPMELRTVADWVIQQRLRTISGVSQIFTMGGERKQFQVQVDPEAMRRFGVSLRQIETAVAESNHNSTGGYLDRIGPRELLVRSVGRIRSVEELRAVAVAVNEGRSISLDQVAQVVEAAQVKRGDSSAYVRGENGVWSGGPAVVLIINKQPTADTRLVVDEVLAAVEEMRSSLPEGVRIRSLYSQKEFIDRAIENVVEALRDGAFLVVVILFAFLMNLRTTFITLTAIPLSLVATSLVFAVFGFSINTMTLGGLAVAIGELVDDAIVDVENIHRRLQENRSRGTPLPPLLVVFRASTEVRNSIVFGTMIVILVFMPLFALGGMEGRLFLPLGAAYVVSILASLVVSLTITPVLSYWLLTGGSGDHAETDGPLLRVLKWLGDKVIRFSLGFPRFNLLATLTAVALAGVFVLRLERDFLPPFNEGTVQLNVILPPGVSLATSNEANRSVEKSLMEIDDVVQFGRRTGRAELDEHAEGVNFTEYLIEFDPHSPRDRSEQLKSIRDAMAHIPGVVTAVEQPIAHLISHMLSGVKAQIGIKVFGDDLETLRSRAEAMQSLIAEVPGVTDLYVEQQVTIPQLRIDLDREKLLTYGLTVDRVNEFVETALNGRVVSEILEGQRSFDLVVRLREEDRREVESIRRLSIELPGGGMIPLSAVADVQESGGPNTINRENVRRRIVIQCNVTERGVVDVVGDIRRAVDPVVATLPPGYSVEYGGQFESQQSAGRMIGLLFVVSMFGVFLVLYTMFGSVNLSLQVMSALPMAFIGAVAALVLTGQTLTIAAMVGFISLAGIASRNGILLLNHYLHLVRHEGEEFTKSMIVRAGLERLAPVLMTALTSGIALVPLVLAADEPGKEILYPVATVILGGLISSTLLDFFVHPALFWLFGLRDAARVVREHRQEVPLVEEGEGTGAEPSRSIESGSLVGESCNV